MINWNDKQEVEIFKDEERVLHMASKFLAAKFSNPECMYLAARDVWKEADTLNARFKESLSARIEEYRAQRAQRPF